MEDASSVQLVRDLGRLRSLADGLTAARAGGASHASWFTSIQGALEYDAKTGFPNWGYTFATGVRNDVVVNSVTYTQDETCWPRASWFAFQRLAWLLGQAAEGGISVVTASAGFVLIRIEFATPIETGPDGTPLQRTWPRAYLCWLDQHCDETQAHLDGSSRGSTTATIRQVEGAPRVVLPSHLPSRTYAPVLSYSPLEGDHELLSLVPQVTVDKRVAAEDTNGYALGRSVEWNWSGWDAALSASTRVAGEHAALRQFTITQADPATVPAPLCFFTSVEFEEV